MKIKLLYIKLLLGIIALFITNEVSAACSGITANFTASATFYCGTGPYTVNFTNTSTGSSPTTSFEWWENGILIGTTPTIAVGQSSTITAVGSYDFMLIAIDTSEPCRDTMNVLVTIAPTPLAGFNFIPNNGCALLDVDFTNTSTGLYAGSTFLWNFGDGNTSTQIDPTHVYAIGGAYNVSLTVTNGVGCTSTINQTVTVIDAPITAIAGDDGDGDLVYCLPPGDNTATETVTFSNTTTGATSYSWDFGDGSPIFNTGSLLDFTHVYSTYGTFTVVMTATHANGCTATETLTVIFEKFVSAGLTLDITEYSGCAPHPVSTLTNLSVNATNFVWDFGDGTVITTTTPTPPAYSYTTSGSYTITLTASNSCNTATATISPIIIIDSPTAGFTPSVTSGCAPQTISFVNNSTGTQPANNYQWDMGNGNTYVTTITPPNQVYPNQGTYTIELIAANACGEDTIIQTVFIDTIPTVDLILDPISGCTPLNVDPTATLLTGTNVNWQWYIDGVYSYNTPLDIPNQNFISLNPNDSTLHTIQVNVSNACGSDFELDSVYVHPPVIANFVTQDTVCLGDLFTFTNQSTGTELTFVWDFGDGSPTITDTNTNHTYLTPGDFMVTLTTTGHCGVDVQTFVVTVVAIPVVDFTPSTLGLCSGETVSFTNNSSLDGSYYWDFGPNGSITSSTLFDPGAISFTGTGTQTVSFAINYSGCLDSDTVYIVVDPLPIPDFTVAPTAGCGPLSTIITNNTVDSPGTSYAWDYGNGTTSTAYIPVNQIYPAPLSDTVYTIQLVVTTPAGCVDSLDQFVNVYSLPVADFTILDDTLCLGQTMTFTNTSTNASNYLWDFGDATTTGIASPTHTYLSDGTFQVTLVAYTPNGCTDTSYQSVYIDSIPVAAFVNTIECFGNTTIFTNNSTGSPVTQSWDFGDGSALDNSLNPTHIYLAAGNYNVSLTVTNAANCSSTFTQVVQVNDVPIADFSWTPTCDGQAMNFTDLSLNTPIGWTWDFGDSFTSGSQNSSHTYADTGTYVVQLVVSGGSGCLDSISMNVYVDSIPQAGFAFTSVCTNDLTIFTDNSTYSPDNYLWDFGDATSSTLSNPTHIYTSPGTYSVTLTVDYAATGCSHSISQDIEAFPRTVPSFTANTPCLGELTDFLDQSTNTPIQWEWDFGDGSAGSTLQNPSHLYLVAGLFDITLITENVFGCSDTLIQQIEIYGLPVADFSSTVVCNGAGTQFADLSTDDVSWEWDFGDAGAGSLLENPIHIFTTDGTYTTQLIAFNAVGCSDTITHTVTVNPNPTAGFYADTACFGYLTSFTDTSLNAVAWLYDFGDGANSIAADPSHTYPSDGTYNVQQLVTNVFGCQDSTIVDILVSPQPVTGFTNLTVCAEDVVDFTDTTAGSPVYWEWDFGDGLGTSSNQNPTYIYPLGGLYDVELIAGNAVGCLDTTLITIEVYTNPVALFEADTVCFLDITTFTDLSTDVVPLASWYYDFGDGINVSTLQNPTYIYQSAGTYPASLTVTNIYGCDSTFQLNVVVNNVPIADFTVDTVCWGSPTTFTDISIGSVNTWNWDFGNGASSTNGPIESYTYPAPGSYLASMEVDGGVGCTDIAYHVVVVVEVLTPAIGVQPTACLQEIVQFQDLSVTTTGVITSWNWDFGDGSTSALQDPTHAYLTPGTYTVTLDVQTSNGCTNTGTITITVFDPPVSTFDFTIPCEGQPTIFTDNSTVNSGTVNYWEWDFGDASPLSFDPSPSHTYAAAGNYPVILIVGSTNGCNDTLQQTVTIYPSPTADFVSGLECGGVPVSLSSTSTGTIVNYEWIYAGSSFSSAQDTLYAFPTDTDTHPVTLVVTTDLGCIDSVTHDVITKPVVSFDFGPFETAGCPVMEVSFFENSVVTSGGTIVNWLWDMGDGTFSFSQNPTHFYEDEGTYSISLQVITDQDCVYSDTLAYSIIVYPQPTANFIYSPVDISILNPEVEFTNTSSGAQDVEWHFGDFDYSNDWHPTHTYSDTGYFEVSQTVYNEYGCPDTMYQTLYVHGEFVVYAPNTFTPNNDGLNDFFNIKAYGLESYELHIFNRWGELIHTITEFDQGWDGTYRGQTCQTGAYTWKLVGIDFEKVPREYVGHVILAL